MNYTEPYIDIHTHRSRHNNEIIEVVSLMMKDLDVSNLPSKYTSAGIHPWVISDATDHLKKLENHIRKNKLKAIGECGLDKLCETPFEDQLAIFKKQIKLSKKYEVPVVVHCVKAYDQILAIKKNSSDVSLIIHGFRGKEHLARQLLDKGIYLSFGESLFRDPNIQKLVMVMPLKQLFLETDEADIDIRAIYEWVADLRGITVKELKEILYKNFRRIFL